jgi:polyhydroxyalkanoate synthesis regulator phasin
MGKRKRRLHSPKYAKKYASVRETYNRLRGVVKEAEADGIITEEEAVQIKQAKEAVVEAVVETVVEEVAEIVEKVEEVVKPVVKKGWRKKTPAKQRSTKRSKKTTKTEG